MVEKELPLCACGCGKRVAKKGNQFILGHNFRGKSHTLDAKKKIMDAKTGIPSSPEACAAISAGQMGHEVSEDTRKAISEANINFEAAKAQFNTMRGGLDLVWHHVAYDFGRPEALRVRIKRKFHGQIHNPKGCKFGTHGYSLID